MGLISIVYVSYTSYPMLDDDLKEILLQSRENNNKIEVTGMLLYRDGFFIQALEGEETVVLPLFDKISQDSRHSSVRLVSKENIVTRSFQDWSMGFNHISDQALEELEGFSNYLNEPFKTELFTETPSKARQLLNKFRNQNYF